jgi:hypothetical protein
MASFKVKLFFKAPLRATKPISESMLVERHLEATKGRILQYLRAVKASEDEEKLRREMEKWLEGLLNVFPRKILKNDGHEIEQIAFPASWIYGVLEERAAALKIKGVTRGLIKNAVEVRPYLIGLRKSGRPATIEDIIFQDDTVVSADKFGKRTALKRFEALLPPLETQTFYINVYAPAIKLEDLKKLLEFGRLGASRGQGYGAFHARIMEI